MLESEPAPWEALERVHDADLLERIRSGTLGVREERGLGLPWSPELVERGRRSSWSTVSVAREALRVGVAMNIGGGTHHAGRAFARGYCLFNDVALAVSELRLAGEARRALVVDCDVHQGDGTADLLGPDPDAFCLSLHGARNYPFKRIPSDLDVDLPTGTDDAGYLSALAPALETALAAGPFDLAFYLAGADPWEGDRLGRLSLTKPGLRARDALVLDAFRGPPEFPSPSSSPAATPRTSRTRSTSTSPPRSRSGREWSQPGSNRRPPPCKGGALPAELWPLAGLRVGGPTERR